MTEQEKRDIVHQELLDLGYQGEIYVYQGDDEAHKNWCCPLYVKAEYDPETKKSLLLPFHTYDTPDGRCQMFSTIEECLVQIKEQIKLNRDGKNPFVKFPTENKKFMDLMFDGINEINHILDKLH